MPLKTIKLQGKLTGDESTKHFTLSYELGKVESITSGRWEMAISSVCFFFGRAIAWNSIFELSTNYIDSTIPCETGTIRQPMPISVIRVRGAPGEKLLLGFKCRDFFEIIRPSNTFILNFDEIDSTEYPAPTPPLRKRSLEVTVLVLLRRIQ